MVALAAVALCLAVFTRPSAPVRADAPAPLDSLGIGSCPMAHCNHNLNGIMADTTPIPTTQPTPVWT